MKLKKTQLILLSVLIVVWVIVILWAGIKTTLKLSKPKVIHKELLPQAQVKEADVKQAPQKEAPEKPRQETPPKETPKAAPPIAKTDDAPRASAILVRAFKVKRTDFSDLLPAMGTIKGETEVELKFEINGLIKSIYFHEGEKVKKGGLIASLDPKDAELKLEYIKNKRASTRAAYESRLRTLEVNKKLYEAGAIIKSKLEETEWACESAKYELETVKSEEKLAENELKKTNIVAPIDGVIGPREAEEGEFVTPQDKILSLFGIANVKVELGIVERDINKIKLGQNTKVYTDSYPNEAFEGVIDSISPVIEGKSRTLTAKIKVNNPKELLLPGMFCRAEILIIELKDALLIPSTSLIHTEEGMTLIPVIPADSIEIDKDEVKTGTVQLRQISVGYITSDYADIRNGVNEDDLVVIETQGELKNNIKARITTVEEISF